MDAVRKYSKKREAILGAIRATKEHPSAEMLYAALKPLYPDLSLGTVYRNLSLFLSEGDVICVGTVNGQDRYDGNTEPHAHFICQRCSRVLDLDLKDRLSGLYRDVQRQTGGSIRSHALTFSGLCADCLAKEGH
jgi:Fur family peroxide stress response transcriptional regulator